MPLPKAIAQAAQDADHLIGELESGNLPLVDPETGVPIAPAVEPKPAPAAPQTDAFEQKFRSLQGKYDSEMPVLRGQVQTYERINQNLAAQVAQLTEQMTAIQTAKVQTPAPASVTDKDVEQYGSELIDLIKRVSGADAHAVAQAMRGEMTNLANAVGRDVVAVKQNQQQTDRVLYETRLSESVPNWRAINVDAGWLAWLNEYDPIIGGTRQAALTDAYNKFDDVRTVAFLNAYLATVPRSTPAPTPRDELARQIAPRAAQSNAPAPTSDANGRIWTQQEIGDFYRDLLQGKYKHSTAKADQLKQEIDEAVASGRVR
jgi:hypothetical protein